MISQVSKHLIYIPYERDVAIKKDMENPNLGQNIVAKKSSGYSVRVPSANSEL